MEFLQRQQQQQQGQYEQGQEQDDTRPIQARLPPSYSQPRPSTAEETTSYLWDDIFSFGSSLGGYGYGGDQGQSSSRPPGAYAQMMRERQMMTMRSD